MTTAFRPWSALFACALAGCASAPPPVDEARAALEWITRFQPPIDASGQLVRGERTPRRSEWLPEGPGPVGVRSADGLRVTWLHDPGNPCVVAWRSDEVPFDPGPFDEGLRPVELAAFVHSRIVLLQAPAPPAPSDHGSVPEEPGRLVLGGGRGEP